MPVDQRDARRYATRRFGVPSWGQSNDGNTTARTKPRTGAAIVPPTCDAVRCPAKTGTNGMALAGIILGFVWIGLGFIELGLALS